MRVSTASILKNTGRSWDDWVKVLNKAGAQHWTHQEIVAFVRKKYKLRPYWQQWVTLGYEVASGRRIEGQNLKGEYQVTATRVFPVDAKTLWSLISSPDGLRIWLRPMSDFVLQPKQMFEVEGGIFGQVRTMKANVRARLSWQETDWAKPTVLNVSVISRPGKKSILVFQHEALRTTRQREDMRAYWKARLTELLELC